MRNLGTMRKTCMSLSQGLASTIGVLADAVDAAATGLGDATRQLQCIAALLRAAFPDNR